MVSEIGFGAWGIGGATPGATSYGATSDEVSLLALRKALDLGIDFFDTANVYGDGHSEALIGCAIRDQRRDRVTVATKGGMTRFGARPDFSPDALERSLHDSLRRLGTGYVDLFQLHNPDIVELRNRPEILATLARFQTNGWIRAFGFSVATPNQGMAMLREFEVASLQVNLNMLDLRAKDVGLLAIAADCGVGIIARTPLCFGFLGTMTEAQLDFTPDDHRSRWPMPERRAWLAAANEAFASLGQLEEGARPVTALRFCLSYPAVATAIAGMMTPVEVATNAQASIAGPLSAAQVAAVEANYRALGLDKGPPVATQFAS